jgi:hypothetical protein
MFNVYKRLALLAISFFISILSFAQGLGNSPYSRVGLGDIMNQRGTIRNMGMGYAGSSLTSKEYINFLNPAGLANFKGKYSDSLVKFDVGFTIQYKTVTGGGISSNSNGANINHLAFTFPVSKVYTMGLMLAPMTTVQNKYSYTSSVPNDPNNYSAIYKYVGDGGIYQFQWMNGIGITKDLSLGVTASYNFGNITQEASSQLITDASNPDKENEIGTKRKTNYSGLSFKPGFIYNRQLTIGDTVFYRDSTGRRLSIKKIPEPISFKFSGALEVFPDIKGTESRALIIRNPKNQLTLDSTLSKSTSHAYIPTTYRIGTSFEKAGNWTLAGDIAYTNWSNFDKNKFKNDSLSSASYSISIGGEWTPQSVYKDKSKGYRLHRLKTYRAGFCYSQTPIVVAGSRLYDYSASIGASIPVGFRTKDKPLLPKLNVAFVVGQRSTFSSDQVSEMYYRLHLSMTIYDKWFHKRRIQ